MPRPRLGHWCLLYYCMSNLRWVFHFPSFEHKIMTINRFYTTVRLFFMGLGKEISFHTKEGVSLKKEFCSSQNPLVKQWVCWDPKEHRWKFICQSIIEKPHSSCITETEVIFQPPVSSSILPKVCESQVGLVHMASRWGDGSFFPWADGNSSIIIVHTIPLLTSFLWQQQKYSEGHHCT